MWLEEQVYLSQVVSLIEEDFRLVQLFLLLADISNYTAT